MDIREIESKIKGTRCAEEARKYLTDEELVSYIHSEFAPDGRDTIGEEEVCVIAEILRVLGARNYTVAHTSLILSTTKTIVERIARFSF